MYAVMYTVGDVYIAKKFSFAETFPVFSVDVNENVIYSDSTTC